MATTAVKSKSTELSPIAQRVKAIVTTSKGATLPEVLAAARNMAEVARRRAAEVIAPSNQVLPKPEGELVLTQAQKDAIAKYERVLADAPALPSSPRELEQHEIDGLVRVFLAAKEVDTVLKPHVKGIRAAILNHLTLLGERLGKVGEETERDKTGWALINEKFSVEGESKKLSVECSRGTASISAQAIEAMEAEGIISHKDALEATRHVRVIDETGFFTLLRRKPELADELHRRATYSAPSIALYAR